jgi:hypothetical protein
LKNGELGALHVDLQHVDVRDHRQVVEAAGAHWDMADHLRIGHEIGKHLQRGVSRLLQPE